LLDVIVFNSRQICAMKYILSSIVLFVVCSANLIGQQNAAEMAVLKGASMTFEAPHVHIGEVKKGDKVEMEFPFTNTGTEDLKIEIVSGCECTTLDWPRKAFKPGETGFISAVFDSTEKEKSETVEIDINLENIDPNSGYPMFKIISYTFELIK